MEALELVDKLAAKEETKSYLIQVLTAFQNLDYHKLSDLLDDDCYYEDMKKTTFIYQQMQRFQKFREKEDTYLHLSTNICTGCLCSEPIFVFTGNTSGLKYAIYVEFIEDDITDIYRCAEHSDWMDGETPF